MSTTRTFQQSVAFWLTEKLLTIAWQLCVTANDTLTKSLIVSSRMQGTEMKPTESNKGESTTFVALMVIAFLALVCFGMVIIILTRDSGGMHSIVDGIARAAATRT
jgi:hypothetical protein